MLAGVGLNLKDKRVEKILKAKGIVNADIYHSPISGWLILLLLLLPSAVWLLYAIGSSDYWFFLILYFLASYLINAYRNNSFALDHEKLMIVNPNFPFRKIKTIHYNSIKLVTIDKLKLDWLMPFLTFWSNHLLIQTNDQQLRYYCSGLEDDGFDENWTEKTIDMLDAKLRQVGITTEFKL